MNFTDAYRLHYTKLNRARNSANLDPRTFHVLTEKLPDFVFDKLNGAEIGELLALLYAQKIYGENELYAEFADVIRRGTENQLSNNG